MAALGHEEARRLFRDRLLITLGLRRKPLCFFCQHCGKLIPSDIAWKCGICDELNYRTKRYSVLHKCHRCKRPPQIFHCPHCDEPLFFGGTRDTTHAARKIESELPPITEEESRARRKQTREDERIERAHELYMANLDAQLAEMKARMKNNIPQSPREKLEEDYSEHEAHFMAVHEIRKREHASNQQRYANDEEMLKRSEDSLTYWVEHQTTDS